MRGGLADDTQQDNRGTCLLCRKHQHAKAVSIILIALVVSKAEGSYCSAAWMRLAESDLGAWTVAIQPLLSVCEQNAPLPMDGQGSLRLPAAANLHTVPPGQLPPQG